MPDPTPALRPARRAAAGVQTLAVALAVVEVARLATIGEAASVLAGAVAVAVLLPLHAQHLRYGLRGLRPPRAGLTLAVMVAVHAAALEIIGPTWSFMLATLATSGLIVLPRRWSLALFVACCVAPALPTFGQPLAPVYGATYTGYLMYSVLFRAAIQFALVWLVAAAHQLVLTRTALGDTLVDRERGRLEAQAHAAVQRRVDHAEQEAELARRALQGPHPGSALAALDRIVNLADDALADLRRVVGGTRPGAVVDILVAVDTSPVGDALVAPRARRLAVVVYATVLPFILLRGVGILLPEHGSPHPVLAALAWLALTAIQICVALAVVRGRRLRREVPIWVVTLVLGVGLRPILGGAWQAAIWVSAAVAAVVLTGRARVVVLLLVPVFFLVTNVLVPDPGVGLLSALATNAWDVTYEVTITVLAAGGLYGAPRLVALVDDLQAARAELAHLRVEAERRRFYGDLHDVLGQSLTALSLKARLARRLAAADPAGAAVEVDEVRNLAAGQAAELHAVVHGERPVTFEVELRDALQLLHRAGTTVHTDIDIAGLADLDEATNALLGRVVREGTTNILRHATPTRCAIRAATTGPLVVLDLRNDGADPVGPDGGTGLRALAERVHTVGGTFSADPGTDGTFRLQVTLSTVEPT